VKVEVDLPNEGPVVNGLVQLPDGSGVLPPFVVRVKCDQCGKDPQDLAFLLKDKPCRCGRTAVQLSAERP
jgi:hypothetical protein